MQIGLKNLTNSIIYQNYSRVNNCMKDKLILANSIKRQLIVKPRFEGTKVYSFLHIVG